MSEHDAHNALTTTARMRARAEPVEDGKLMTFSERMYRAREAQLLRGRPDMYYRPLSSPDFRDGDMARIIAARIDRLPDFRDGMREPMKTDVHYRSRVWYAHASSRQQFCTQMDIDVAAGYTLDLLGAKYGVLRKPLREPDFRDGRCVHGEGRYSCPTCAVQDGRV